MPTGAKISMIALAVGITSCQLVSGAGDYTFAPAARDDGITLSWAFQLENQDTFSVTSLFAVADAAVVMGHYSQSLIFDDRVGDADSKKINAMGDEDGFVFVAGPGLTPAPTGIQGSNATIVRPQAIAFVSETHALVAGVVDGTLVDDPTGNTGQSIFVSLFGPEGSDYARIFPAPTGEVVVKDMHIDGVESAVYVSGYSSGGIAFSPDTATTDAQAGFVVKLDLTTLGQQVSNPVMWARSVDGSGDDRIMASVPREDGGVIVYGDYASSLLLGGSDINAPDGGAGSLFLMSLDTDGNAVPSERFFLESTTGTARAASLAVSDDGRYLIAGDFTGTMKTISETPPKVGQRALLVAEFEGFDDETYVGWFGDAEGFHTMAGAGYVDDADGGPPLITFAASCVEGMMFAGEQSRSTTSDLCLGFLGQQDEPGSYAEVAMLRFGDEDPALPEKDQKPVALVTQGTNAIIYGSFEGSLLDDVFVNNKTAVEDGFVMSLDFAPQP